MDVLRGREAFIRPTFHSYESYFIDFAAAVAEEIKFGISVGMIQTEMVVKRALGITRKRDNTGSSVGSLVRRSPKEVKNLVQGHGVPYYTDVRVFVIPLKVKVG